MLRTLSTAIAVMGLAAHAFAADYKVELSSVTAQTTIAVRATVKDEAEMGTKFQEIIPKLVAYAQQHQDKLAGQPYSRYHRYEPGTAIDVEVGFPTTEKLEGTADVLPSELPGGAVATTTHTGDYQKIGEAYQALHTWITENGKEITGGPWEVYVKTGNKPEDNVTQLYFPIK